MWKKIDIKIVLYILLGGLIFALFNAWQDDHQVPVKHDEVEVVNKSVITAENKYQFLDDAKRANQPKSDVGEEISVITDQLKLKISLKSGAITELALRNYPETLHGKDHVKLLTQQPNRFYATESVWLLNDKPLANEFVADKKSYQMGEDANLEVTLVSRNKDFNVEKKYRFERGSYAITVEDRVINRDGYIDGLRLVAEIERSTSVEREKDSQRGYVGAAISSPEKPYEKLSFSDIKKIVSKKHGKIRRTKGGWIAMQERYFITTIIPEQDHEYNYFCNVENGKYGIGYYSDVKKLKSNEEIYEKYTMYAGPEMSENLAPLARGLERTVDYGWLWIISVALFWVLKLIYRFVGNWGLAIIILTLLIKLLFLRLSENSYRSMAKMKTLMPKLQALKERYGDDRQQLSVATMELYKKEQVNPLSLGGCLPMIIQIPFFIAVYYVLVSAVELRHAPLVLWIQDLSTKDPYYVLPILMGLSMFWQQKMTPQTMDGVQAKMMMVLPIVMTLFFINFPAGLVLYWLMNNIFSILQQIWINRRLVRESKRR